MLAASAPLLVQAGEPTADADPLAQNAALKYWRAFALLPELDDKHDKAVADAVAKPGPLDAQPAEVVRSSEPALRELHRGAAYARCVWGLTLDDGPELMLPHLGKARKLARVGLLRTQWNFQQGRPAEAISDLLATMTLGRHASSDSPIMVSLLVSYAMESQAVSVAAGYLDQLGPAERKQLTEGLDRLPSMPRVRAAVLSERAHFLEPMAAWLSQPGGLERVRKVMEGPENPFARLSPEEAREAVAGLGPIYDKLVELVDSPSVLTPDAQKRLLEESKLSEPTRKLAEAVLPGVVAVQQAELGHRARMVLLKAAIAVLQEGEGALSKPEYQDPLGGALQYTKTPAGFRLQSKTVGRDGEPVALEIAPVAKR
jgi:hypothetical protein